MNIDNPTEFIEPANTEIKVAIILAEYKALREELMYFIDAQRNVLRLLFTAAFGQTLIIVVQGTIRPKIAEYLLLFVVPMVIFLLMLSAMEMASKIFLIADYIHKGIKAQLGVFFDDNTEFFLWEEHKGKTIRINRQIVRLLDYSRWWIFGIGITVSFGLGLWFSVKSSSQAYQWLPVLIAGVLDFSFIVIAAVIAQRFNECEGESRFSGGPGKEGR